MKAIADHAERIDFRETDGLKLLEEYFADCDGDVIADPSTVIFVDPPYTIGGKRAGRRLYTHNEIDHARLFEMLARSGSDFLMTYDKTCEIIRLSEQFGFHAVRVLMKNTHHATIPELIITPKPVFVH